MAARGLRDLTAVALVTAARIAEADVRQAFTERIEIFEGIYMVPEGSPSESGNVTSSAYDVTGEQDGSSWKGYIAATVGGFEWTALRNDVSNSASLCLGKISNAVRHTQANPLNNIFGLQQ